MGVGGRMNVFDLFEAMCVPFNAHSDSHCLLSSQLLAGVGHSLAGYHLLAKDPAHEVRMHHHTTSTWWWEGGGEGRHCCNTQQANS